VTGKKRFSPKRPLSKRQIGNVPDDLPAVYELLNRKGENIYTGLAKRSRVRDRIDEHLPGGQDSVPGASGFRIKQMPSVELARKEEKRIIKQDKPKYNE